MTDQVIQLIVLVVSLTTAITSLRTARLNWKLVRTKDPTTIAMNPRQKRNLVSALLLMLICVSILGFEIYLDMVRASVLVWATVGLIVAAFFIGTHAGLFLWADVIVKRLDNGDLILTIKNYYLSKHDIVKTIPK